MAKVSVIIPVYNVENYLRECLDSVINQSLEDIEIICVNDGSTDNSLAILDEYKQNFKNIKVIDKTNSGAGDCRNIGLNNAEGDYVIFFDSDDYMDKNCLEKLYNMALIHNSDITLCRSFEFVNNTNKFQPINSSIEEKLIDYKNNFNPKEISKYIFQFCIGWPWDKLYKRKFILENNLWFQNLRHSNDTYFVLMSLVCANIISYINYYGVYHRIHVNSLANTRIKKPDCFYFALIKLMQELKDREFYNTYEQSFVNYCLTFPYWHITTISDKKAKKVMQNKYKEILEKVHFKSFGKEYFYDTGCYKNLHYGIFRKILQQIFSLKNLNDKKHKQITVLGVKIKIKRKIKQ